MKRSEETSLPQPSREGGKGSSTGNGRRLMERIGKRGVVVVSSVFVASVTVAMLHGCSQQQGAEQQAQQSTQSEAVVATHPGEVAPPAPSWSQGSTSNVEHGMDSAESVPPEVDATVSDTLVVPGGVFEITAETSPDVTEVTLRDRVGRMQAFAYDSSSSVWRTYYRAPIKPTERLGLSVTAKTPAERWSRVWVFTKVQPETSVEPATEQE
jgi:hypothetical protein